MESSWHERCIYNNSSNKATLLFGDIMILEELQIELASLQQRAEDINYLLIEAEGSDIENYRTELEEVECQIEVKMSDIFDFDSYEPATVH